MIWKKAIVTRFHSNEVTIQDLESLKIINSSLRGKFKQQKIRPIVGDYVEYSEDANSAKIENILPHKNKLQRPNIANVDQVVLVTTLKDPFVDLLIVDKFLVQVEKAELECIILVNKTDLLDTEEDQELLQAFLDIYSDNYTVIPVSAKNNHNVDNLKIVLSNKVSTLAGMSGVGKSSLLNSISPGLGLRVNEISDKLRRGRHTTTYTELHRFDFGGYVADTPGFANLELIGFNSREIKNYYRDFDEIAPYCGFNNCVHINEPNCAVKDAYENDELARSRYENYVSIYNEIMERGEKKW